MTTTKRIRGLSTLRAIATIGILLYHAFPNFMKGGFFGVIIFFVLTGYLKGYSMHYAPSLLEYYRKRLSRLYIPLIIVIFASVGMLVLVDKYKLVHTPEEILSILFAYNNFWQIKMNSNYFTNLSNTSLFTHLWYLSIIVQFDLVWPFLQRLYLRLLKESKVINVRSMFILMIGFSFFVLPFITLLFKDINYTVLYYHTLTRVFSILAGVGMGLIDSDRKRHIPYSKVFARSIYALFIIVTIILFLYAEGTSKLVYVLGMQLYTLLVCVVIHIFVNRPSAFHYLVDDIVSKFIATYSYEIYLWQYPILFLTSILFKNATYIPKILPIIITILLSIWLKSFVLFLSNHKRINIVELLFERVE